MNARLGDVPIASLLFHHYPGLDTLPLPEVTPREHALDDPQHADAAGRRSELFRSGRARPWHLSEFL